MGKLKYDLTGKTFGDWKVISYAGLGRWKSRCKCGTEDDVIAWNLSSGHTTRCDKCRRKSVWKHGQAGHAYKKPCSPTYSSWQAMRRRCLDPNNKNFHLYGGRGIKVCRRWDDFRNFLKDMGEKPSGMTLERKNRKGNYTPGNCCWATIEVQANNRSNNHPITINGEARTIAQWCRHYGIGYACAFRRLQSGMEPLMAFTAKTDDIHSGIKWVTVGRRKKSVAGWAREVGVRAGMIYQRLAAGWGPREAVFGK